MRRKWKLAALFLIATTFVTAAVARPHNPSILKQIDSARLGAWKCQASLGAKKTKTNFSYRKTSSRAYKGWVLGLWRGREIQCLETHTLWRSMGLNDYRTAARYIQRIWPGTESWLVSCARSEGGLGRFVMNRQGSDAGGNLQFMPGTFYGNADDAFLNAQHRGFLLPKKAFSWYSPLGQAATGAYMRFYGLDRGHWIGAGC